MPESKMGTGFESVPDLPGVTLPACTLCANDSCRITEAAGGKAELFGSRELHEFYAVAGFGIGFSDHDDARCDRA